MFYLRMWLPLRLWIGLPVTILTCGLMKTHAYKDFFSINVWANMYNNLVGPYILPSRLTGYTCNIFLQEVLNELFVDVPLELFADTCGSSTMEP